MKKLYPLELAHLVVVRMDLQVAQLLVVPLEEPRLLVLELLQCLSEFHQEHPLEVGQMMQLHLQYRLEELLRLQVFPSQLNQSQK
jgi:hypothetical protein